MQRVNYNEIALLYDEPWRDHAVDPHLLAFFDAHPELVPSETRILDIGCGTGKQLTANRGRFPDMAMVGVDRFAGMLRIAKQRGPQIAWVNGDGAALPLHPDSVDYSLWIQNFVWSPLLGISQQARRDRTRRGSLHAMPVCAGGEPRPHGRRLEEP